MFVCTRKRVRKRRKEVLAIPKKTLLWYIANFLYSTALQKTSHYLLYVVIFSTRCDGAFWCVLAACMNPDILQSFYAKPLPKKRQRSFHSFVCYVSRCVGFPSVWPHMTRGHTTRNQVFINFLLGKRMHCSMKMVHFSTHNLLSKKKKEKKNYYDARQISIHNCPQLHVINFPLSITMVNHPQLHLSAWGSVRHNSWINTIQTFWVSKNF